MGEGNDSAKSLFAGLKARVADLKVADLTSEKAHAFVDQLASRTESARVLVEQVAGKANSVHALVDQIASKAGGVSDLVKQFAGEVDLDVENRRVMLSDSLIARVVRLAADFSDDSELLNFEWDGAAYRCRVKARNRVVVARILPESVSWTDGIVEFRGSTPEALVIEDAPVQTWLVARFVDIFGGTGFGTKMLSSSAPDGLVWNGRVVTWRRPIDMRGGGLAGLVAEFAMKAAVVEAKISHDAGGLWICVDGTPPAFLSSVYFMLTRLLDARKK